jgi:hypothetical protein
MFERYTERARRVLFFVRYEASQLGSVSIETEHVLLGLLRESKGVIVLPPTDGPERVPTLLRESIQEQFGVDVIREDGDPPGLVVKSR